MFGSVTGSRPQRLALLIPLLFLAAAPAATIASRMLYGGATPVDAAFWVTVAGALFVVARLRPAQALLAMVAACLTLPALRYRVAMGQWLVLLVGAALLLGTFLALRSAGGSLSRLGLHRLALPIGTFGNLLIAGTTLSLMRYSPFVARWLGDGALGAVSRRGIETMPASTSQPIFQSMGLMIGPLFALAVLVWTCRLRRDGGEARGFLDKLRATLVVFGSVNLAAGVGQAFVPGFPTIALGWPTTGLFHHPTGLGILMAMLTPICLSICASARQPTWLRGVAATDLLMIAAVFVPTQSRAGQLGVVFGAALMLAAWAIMSWRQPDSTKKLWYAGGLALMSLLVAGLLLAAAFTYDVTWSMGIDELRSRGSIVLLGDRPRVELNRMALFMIADDPIAGAGVGGFKAQLPVYYEIHEQVGSVRKYHSLLNQPLLIFAELGIIGLAVNAWLLLAFLWPAATALRRGGGSAAGFIELAGVTTSAVTVLLLFNWVGEARSGAAISVSFFVTLALAFGMSGDSGHDESPESNLDWLPLAVPLLYFTCGVLSL